MFVAVVSECSCISEFLAVFELYLFQFFKCIFIEYLHCAFKYAFNACLKFNSVVVYA